MPRKRQSISLYESCLDLIVDRLIIACVNFSRVIDQLKSLKQTERNNTFWSVRANEYREEVEEYIAGIPVLCADDFVRKLMEKFDCFYADFFGMFLHPSTKTINIQLAEKGNISCNIVEALLNNLHNITKVRHLVIPYSELCLKPKTNSKDKNWLLRFLKTLRKLKDLVELDISYIGTNEMLVSLGRYAHKLRYLSLRNCRSLEKGALQKILTLTSLVHIDVRDNQSSAISNYDLALCLEKLPNLEVLRHGNWTKLMNVIQARGKINAPYGIKELFLVAPKTKQLKIMVDNFPHLLKLEIVSCQVSLDKLTTLTKVRDLALSDIPYVETLKLLKSLDGKLESLSIANIEGFDSRTLDKERLVHTCFVYLNSLRQLELVECDNVDLSLIRTCCPLLNSLVISQCSAGSLWTSSEVMQHLKDFVKYCKRTSEMPDLKRLTISGRFRNDSLIPMVQASQSLEYLMLGSSRFDSVKICTDTRFFETVLLVNKLLFLEDLELHSETLTYVSLIALLESLDNLKRGSFHSSRWSAICSYQDIHNLVNYSQKYNMKLQLYDTQKQRDLLGPIDEFIYTTFMM